MAVICPTITVETPEDYAHQLAVVKVLEARVHIDVADNIFTPRQLLPVSQIYWPKGMVCDIHAMLQRPAEELMTIISLRPRLVILHAESQGNLAELFAELQRAGIATGLALLPDTSVESAAALIPLVEHVLIFAGHLGYQGGSADMQQLAKIPPVRVLNPNVEIGWDGGVNDENAAKLAAGGVDVLNAGGYIHKAPDPGAAWQRLSRLAA